MRPISRNKIGRNLFNREKKEKMNLPINELPSINLRRKFRIGRI